MYTVWISSQVSELSFGKYNAIPSKNNSYVFADRCKERKKQAHALTLTHINPYGFVTFVALTFAFINVRI